LGSEESDTPVEHMGRKINLNPSYVDLTYCITSRVSGKCAIKLCSIRNIIERDRNGKPFEARYIAEEQLARHSPIFIMNRFYIDLAYATSVIIVTEHRIKQLSDESEADFLVRKLATNDSTVRSTSSEDHPEFTKLREQLGKEGYIEIVRNCWNADTVLKSFYLNDILFKKRAQFLCGAAILYTLKNGKTSL